MPKLNIIIADSDESYLKGFSSYIYEKQLNMFNVYSFNNRINLEDYFSDNKDKIDILLISPDIFNDSFSNKGITLIAILSNGRIPREFKNCEIINKYQLGDNLVSNVLSLFSDKSTEIIVQSGDKKTSVVSVFSSIGGSGKTTIAYGCALKCAQRGLKVFYLNLENIPSTSIFFETNGISNLSHIFYYLKAKNKNLSLKIEGIKLEDTYSGIHYFSPPERLIDMNDVQPEEFVHLIRELKGMNSYDVIFIDLPSILGKRSLSIFKESDEVLFIITPEISSYIRTQQTIKELEFMSNDDKFNVLSKFTLVLNKTYSGCASEIESISVGEKGISIRIPKVSPLVNMQSGRAFLNMNSIFGEALGAITSRF